MIMNCKHMEAYFLTLDYIRDEKFEAQKVLLPWCKFTQEMIKQEFECMLPAMQETLA